MFYIITTIYLWVYLCYIFTDFYTNIITLLDSLYYTFNSPIGSSFFVRLKTVTENFLIEHYVVKGTDIVPTLFVYIEFLNSTSDFLCDLHFVNRVLDRVQFELSTINIPRLVIIIKRPKVGLDENV